MVLGQGVGAVTKHPMGAVAASGLQCWDAKMPHHLPLPRAVGPYTVLRLTHIMDSPLVETSPAALLCFGPMAVESNAGLDWSTQIAWGYKDNAAADGTLTFQTANRANYAVTATQFADSGLTLTPSAFSVQIICADALQTAAGCVLAGVMQTQVDMRGSDDTIQSFKDNFIQYFSPRVLSAGKLTLRGVQTDAYPLNMNSVSDFRGLETSVPATGVGWANTAPFNDGWSPIVVYNPNGVGLCYLVTVEYRVRFPIFNPAASTHRQYPVASDSLWSKLMAQATGRGHGVQDIVEKIANFGAMAGKAMELAESAGPLMETLALAAA
jgi:hypothetical protein